MKKLRNIISGLLVISMCVFSLYFLTMGQGKVKQYWMEKNETTNESQGVSYDETEDGGNVEKLSLEEMQKHWLAGDCMCEYWAKRYENWEEKGYEISPSAKFDKEHKILGTECNYDFYGVPNVAEQFYSA